MKLFNSLQEAEQFKVNNLEYIASLQTEAELIPEVIYSELWLNRYSPSCVIGFDDEDQEFVSFKI